MHAILPVPRAVTKTETSVLLSVNQQYVYWGGKAHMRPCPCLPAVLQQRGGRRLARPAQRERRVGHPLWAAVLGGEGLELGTALHTLALHSLAGPAAHALHAVGASLTARHQGYFPWQPISLLPTHEPCPAAQVLFMAVPDVLRTPFQTAPLDLDTDAFFESRQVAQPHPPLGPARWVGQSVGWGEGGGHGSRAGPASSPSGRALPLEVAVPSAGSPSTGLGIPDMCVYAVLCLMPSSPPLNPTITGRHPVAAGAHL